MNKLLIALLVIFISIVVVGFCFTEQTNYTEDEIQRINKSIKESAQKADAEKTNEPEEKDTDKKTENGESPEIIVLYPEKFEDGDTVETDRVRLSFSDDKGIAEATMNNTSVDTDKILINTEGTYNISVIDTDGNETKLSFTIKFPEKNTTSNSSINKKSSTKSNTKSNSQNNKNSNKEDNSTGESANDTPNEDKDNSSNQQQEPTNPEHSNDDEESGDQEPN